MKPIRVLARVPLEVPNYQIKYFKPEAFDLLKDTFYAMAMPTVTVRLYDHRGNPYEAAGFDHYLTLAFTYLGPDFSGKDHGPSRRPDVILLDDEGNSDDATDDAPREKDDGGIDPKIVALVGAGGIVAAYVIYRQFKPAGPPPLPF
jgi:hypothetical protein